jgi:hypothetical protein
MIAVINHRGMTMKATTRKERPRNLKEGQAIGVHLLETNLIAKIA